MLKEVFGSTNTKNMKFVTDGKRRLWRPIQGFSGRLDVLYRKRRRANIPLAASCLTKGVCSISVPMFALLHLAINGPRISYEQWEGWEKNAQRLGLILPRPHLLSDKFRRSGGHSRPERALFPGFSPQERR